MRYFIFLAAFLISTGTQAGELKLPTPRQEVLPNGLTIAWFTSDHLPVVDMALLVKSGYRDDPQGRSGAAQLTSVSFLRGAGGLNEQQLAHATEILGASRYVSADEDSFSIGVHGLAPDADALLDILGKISLHPEFAEAEVKREQERVLDGWKHIADSGDSLADLAYQRVITSGTTYARGGILSPREFERLTRQDVLDYYHKNFTPKNALLMIVGRVNEPEFRKKIIETFGAWSGEAPKRSYRDYLPLTFTPKRGEVIFVDRPGLTQAQVRIGFRAPLFSAPEHYSLAVVNALLGEYFHSRLNTLIRDQLALTYGIGSSFAYSKDLAFFTISSATQNESTGKLLSRTMDVLHELKEPDSITAAEAQTAKDYLIGGFPLSTATLGAVATRWLGGYLYALGGDYLNEFIPKVRAVTAKQAQAAVEKDFNLDDLVIVVAGDAKDVILHLKGEGFSEIKKVSVKDLTGQ